MQRDKSPTEDAYPELENPSPYVTPWQWLQGRRRGDDTTITSLGEFFLPFFLAAMEACWFNAILIGLAGLDFLHSGSALLPFWGPPLLLFTAIWLFRRSLQRDTATADDSGVEKNLLAVPGLGLMFVVLAILTLLLIWLHIYSAHYFLLDPGWLLAFGNDLFALNSSFYQALALVVITGYFCWRCIRLAQMTVEPGHVFRQLWVGLLILLIAVLLRAGQARSGNADDMVLVLLVPIFLYVALSTHALARITFIRREHPVGLEGSVNSQERAMLSVITAVGLVLLVLTILGGTLFSPSFFTSVQPFWKLVGSGYDLLVKGLSQLIVWITTPLFWLYTWLTQHFRGVQPKVTPPSSVAQKAPRQFPPVSPVSPGAILAAKILIPVLILAILTLILYLALRRRKHLRIVRARKGGDIHESVWSWQLFWSQVGAFFLSILRWLFPKQALTGEERTQQAEELALPPNIRTIREIYRALLNKASTRGHIRKRDETPHEFRQRLNVYEPQNEPQLGLITEAYALTRYGGASPNEGELEMVRRLWNELEQKWEIPR